MFRKFVPIFSAVVVIAFVNSASADVLWSSRTPTGPNDAGYTFSQDPMSIDLRGGAFLEDGTFNTAGAHTITGVNIGYFNNSSSSASFDILVDFWDTVNYDLDAPANVAIGRITSSPYRLHVSASPGIVAGNSVFAETGLVSLASPVVIPDATFGMSLRFVDTGADAVTGPTNTAIEPIYHGRFNVAEPDPLHPIFPVFPSVFIGSSDDRFGADTANDHVFDANTFDQDGNVTSGDVYSFGQGIFEAAMSFELQGTVPEPSSFFLLAIGSLAILRRRRTQA